MSDHFYKAKKKAKQFGINNLQISTRGNKKYMFRNPNNNKMIHFGAYGYDDFLKHKDLERRARYRKRAEGVKLKDGSRAIDKKYSPAWASLNILW